MNSPAPLRQHVESLVAQGKGEEARALLEQRVAKGDPEACGVLAVWRCTGQHVPRDLDEARRLFLRAAQGGDARAGVIYTNFLAAGVGGTADWPGALDLLRRRSAIDPQAGQQLYLLGEMGLDDKGDPVGPLPEPRIIGTSPDVRLFPKLFSETECAYLAAQAMPLMQPAMVVHPTTGEQIRNPIRTSDQAIFTWPIENPVIHALNRRIAAASGTEEHQGEALQILRYRPGQEYKKHLDALAGLENQRVLTMLVYLNADYEGGETVFPEADLSVRGETGDALLFRNLLPDGETDMRSIHAGLPVTTGVKLIASRWIRQRRFVD